MSFPEIDARYLVQGSLSRGFGFGIEAASASGAGSGFRVVCSCPGSGLEAPGSGVLGPVVGTGAGVEEVESGSWS